MSRRPPTARRSPPAQETVQDRLKRIINNPDPKIAEQLKREEARNHVTIMDLNPTLGRIGVLKASFTLQNKNDFPIKDIVISCEAIAPSGTKLGTYEQTAYVIVPKNGRKIVKDLSFGLVHRQTESTTCRVAGAIGLP